MTITDIRQHFPHVSKRGDIFTVRRSFFYTHGVTAAALVRDVLTAFPTAIIHDSGEVWKPFRGDAPLHRSSHWFVKFSVPEPS